MQAAGLAGCAPEKCYADNIEAWSANEEAINWNAPLAWVAAFLDEKAEVKAKPRPKAKVSAQEDEERADAQGSDAQGTRRRSAPQRHAPTRQHRSAQTAPKPRRTRPSSGAGRETVIT